MSTIIHYRPLVPGNEPIVYPTSDGRPTGETDLHRMVMVQAIDVLTRYYAGQPVYVSGNLLLYYEQFNKRRHLSPDVLVTKGIPPGSRPYYLLWDEGAPPNLVIEVTSASTRSEDLDQKLQLYRDVILVREYFLFDPLGEYLVPPLQGYRLEAGAYVPIAPLNGRLPSLETGLYLEKVDAQLRFYNPATSSWLLSTAEHLEQSTEEIARLRQELENLRQSKSNG